MPEGQRNSGPRKSIVTSTETMLARQVIVKEERMRRLSNEAYFDRDDRTPHWEPRAQPLDKKAEEFMSTLPRRSSAPRIGYTPEPEPVVKEELDIAAIKKRMGSLQMLQLGMGNAR